MFTTEKAEVKKGIDIRPASEGVKVDLLSCFYKHVMVFPDYLKILIPELTNDDINKIFYEQSEDSLSRLTSLKSALIACDLDQIPSLARSDTIGNDSDMLFDLMRDIITRVQARIIRNQKTTFSTNMLTLGYRKADDRSIVMNMVDDLYITNVHVNSCVTQFTMGKEWHWILSKIGELAMDHILTHTAIFVPLLPPAQSNLVQILGHSIGELKEPEIIRSKQSKDLNCTGSKKKRRRKSNREEQMKTKRIRLDTAEKCAVGNSSMQHIQHLPAEIDFLRSRIFYSKTLRTRTGKILHGLPSKHILQRAFADKFVSGEGVENAELSLKIRINLLCKHIWPCEHGLPNVFSHLGKNKDQSKEFERRMLLTNRCEDLQIRGPVKTPKRLSNCKPLLRLMILKHDKFDYRRALDLCCPSPLPKRSLTKAEKEGIVKELSETQREEDHVPTQRNFETQAETQAPEIFPFHHDIETATQTCGIRIEKKKSQKPRYARYKSPHGCVVRFVRLVLRSIIPIELFGSYHNRKVVLELMDGFVRSRRFESMNLHQVSQNFRILDCEWLLPRNQAAQNQRPTKEEMMKRQNLLNELLFWLFDGLLVPLLKTNFYATESAKFRNHVFYFRTDVWSKITEPIIQSLKKDRFERVGKHKAVGIMSRRSFGYSFIRLLPKEIGMRPIMNLRRRSTKIDRNAKSKGKQRSTSNMTAKRKSLRITNDEWSDLIQQNHSINSILNTTFHVLNLERQEHPELLGSSVFGPQDVHERLLSFKKRIQQRYKESTPTLYFVKMDVAGAFDCIDQTKLLEIVHEIIRHDRYVVQRYNKLTLSNGQPFRTWPKVACPEEDHEPFLILAQHLAEMQAWRSTIVSDSVVYPQCDKKSLIWLLNEHISNNLIKVGKDFCLQTVGIPQGSSLSTLLCCYYLAKMEEELRLTGVENESLLMRYTDDFLFISTDINLAKKFFVNVLQGSAKFNCSIAPEKTECNFVPYDAQMNSGLANAALSVKIHQPSSSSTFPWCSYRIDTQSLGVQYDLERYRNTCVSDSLTIPIRNAFGSTISRTITQSVQRQNLPIYLDLSLNSINGVLKNIHQMFIVGCLKFVAVLKIIKVSKKGKLAKRSEDFILNAILTNIEHAYAHAKSKMVRTYAQEMYKDQQDEADQSKQTIWPIPVLAYRWMAMHAITSVLALRPSTGKLGFTMLLKEKMQAVQTQIQKKYEKSKDLGELKLIEFSTLKCQASESFKEAKPVLRSMTLKR